MKLKNKLREKLLAIQANGEIRIGEKYLLVKLKLVEY